MLRNFWFFMLKFYLGLRIPKLKFLAKDLGKNTVWLQVEKSGKEWNTLFQGFSNHLHNSTKASSISVKFLSEFLWEKIFMYINICRIRPPMKGNTPIIIHHGKKLIIIAVHDCVTFLLQIRYFENFWHNHRWQKRDCVSWWFALHVLDSCHSPKAHFEARWLSHTVLVRW